MGKTYKERLSSITALIFDLDGVFTDGTIGVLPGGEGVRQLFVKDEYAVKRAVEAGLTVAVSGNDMSEALTRRFRDFGAEVLHGNGQNASRLFDFIEMRGLATENVLYMGDDIPDISFMRKMGMGACPSDAGEEIKRIAHYVSHAPGGRGCVRDVIEQTLKVQNRWFPSGNLNKQG